MEVARSIAAFFRHLLERIDWRSDLHFQTCTTIDTLDYSGTGLNAGSKLVIAAAGPRRRTLAAALPGNMRLPGVLQSAYHTNAFRALDKGDNRRLGSFVLGVWLISHY